MILETYLQVERHFRGYMNEVWATPTVKHCLRFAFQELSEYDDADMRSENSNYTRNTEKNIDAQKELSQCWFMLLSALSGTVKRKDTLKNANQMFLSQNVWLKSFDGDGDGLVLLGLALNSLDYLSISKAFSWVHNKLSSFADVNESVLEVMEIWHNKFYLKKYDVSFDRKFYENILANCSSIYYDDVYDIPVQYQFEWTNMIDYNVPPNLTEEDRRLGREELSKLIQEAKSTIVTDSTDFYGYDYEVESEDDF